LGVLYHSAAESGKLVRSWSTPEDPASRALSAPAVRLKLGKHMAVEYDICARHLIILFACRRIRASFSSVHGCRRIRHDVPSEASEGSSEHKEVECRPLMARARSHDELREMIRLSTASLDEAISRVGSRERL
jgi:hypothetical protein